MSKMKKAKRKPTSPRNSNATDEFIGIRMRERRQALGIKQADLAKTLGVSYQQIQKYETGKNRVSAGRLFDICRALNVSLCQCLNATRRGRADEKPAGQAGGVFSTLMN